MSSMLRKVKRNNIISLNCCHSKMTRKDSYCTATKDLYVCEKCGKEKIIERK